MALRGRSLPGFKLVQLPVLVWEPGPAELIATVSAGVETLTDTDVETGERYRYWVTTYDAPTESDPSNIVEGVA